MCSVWFAGAWKTLAEEVPFKSGLKDGQKFLQGREEEEEHFTYGGSSMCKVDKSLQNSGQRGIQWDQNIEFTRRNKDICLVKQDGVRLCVISLVCSLSSNDFHPEIEVYKPQREMVSSVFQKENIFSGLTPQNSTSKISNFEVPQSTFYLLFFFTFFIISNPFNPRPPSPPPTHTQTHFKRLLIYYSFPGLTSHFLACTPG